MSIECKDITKQFGSTRALDQVSLTLEPGHIYGLLGNNGAGKSTLLSILTDRQLPDQGTVTVDGQPVRNNDAALHKVFMVGEQNFFPEDMKIKRALHTMTYFYPDFDLRRAHGLAKQFGLSLKKKIPALSTGYSSIFRLILGLSVNTPYVIFDEPVLGLDAQHRELFYRLLVEKFMAVRGSSPDLWPLGPFFPRSRDKRPRNAVFAGFPGRLQRQTYQSLSFCIKDRHSPVD